MAVKKTGASYLDRPLFTFSRENLSAGTPLILAGLIVSGIGLVYAVLVIFYLLMAFQPDRAINEPEAKQPSFSKSAEVVFAGDEASSKHITFSRSIEELQTLPPLEILSRLSLKSGADRVKTNVPPGAEISFMIVFDKLPNDMTEYRLDPVGSSRVE